MFSSSAAIAASRTNAFKSAPVNPAVESASIFKSTSSPSGVFRARRVMISSRSSHITGGGTNSKRSNRPGRRSAPSTKSGRFVAAITATDNFGFSAFPELPLKPSISPSSCVSTRSFAVGPPRCPPFPRAPTSPSSSSRNITEGAACFALVNSARTAFSLSPTYLLCSSGPFTVTKLRPLALATARASMVLEHPGGPYSSVPFGGTAPILRMASP
mmetsp:Transcript_1223/g.4651  ORF Transcript_1223/g.4651 Transcript_1223/m.4651 type:complete len:215 (+) Transcript_1223:172-816(+)